MYRLAQGVKWFGVGFQPHESVKQIEELQGKLTFKFKSKQPQFFEHMIAMSEFSRWNQISKYFLPSRSGEFLKLEYKNIISCPEKCAKFTSLLMSVGDFK